MKLLLDFSSAFTTSFFKLVWGDSNILHVAAKHEIHLIKKLINNLMQSFRFLLSNTSDHNKHRI